MVDGLRSSTGHHVCIIGAGPAGLIAAERLAGAGCKVIVYERMPSPARKFLMAGRGGLNLTHSEPLEAFLSRYVEASGLIESAVRAFPPSALIDWARSLGTATFTGSSGRVFPRAMKASPLLRAWLKRLQALGVLIKSRHTWLGFDDAGQVLIANPEGVTETVDPHAVLLALGGASWPRLGSDGAWTQILARKGIAISPLLPSNCGVEVEWSEFFSTRFEGKPLKRIAITCAGQKRRGEAIITRRGLEGGAVYAVSDKLRKELRQGPAQISIDLRPDVATETLAKNIARTPAKESVANRLRKAASLDAAALALLREAGPLPRDALELAQRIKAIDLRVESLAGIERAISSAGGIQSSDLTQDLMLKKMPGVFAAGEMLDFDAPTGGYLLQAAFASGTRAAQGILDHLSHQNEANPPQPLIPLGSPFHLTAPR